jgi:hypothetical protein
MTETKLVFECLGLTGWLVVWKDDAIVGVCAEETRDDSPYWDDESGATDPDRLLADLGPLRAWPRYVAESPAFDTAVVYDRWPGGGVVEQYPGGQAPKAHRRAIALNEEMASGGKPNFFAG